MKYSKTGIPLIRNNETWTEARYNQFVKGLIREGLSKWGPRHSCIKKARVSRGKYKCELCKEIGPATLPPLEGRKRRRKNIVADHIEPLIDPAVGFVSWDDVIDRAFVEEDGFQALCYECHKVKTKAETDIRTARMRREKLDSQ